MSEPGPDPTARPIVAGVTDSPASAAAAATAARIARTRDLPLRLVRAVATEPEPGGLPRPRTDRESARAAARAALEDVGRSTGLPSRAVTAVVREGPAELVLLHEARTAALLVLGGRPRSGAASLAGTVTETLVRRSPCPVLVDRQAAGQGTIVVGVSGTPGTAVLLAATAAEAARRGSALLVLHGWAGASEGAAAAPAVDDAERALCAGYLEPLRAQFPGLRVDVRVEHGRPEDYLLRAAADAELLVVGRRAQGDRSCTAAVVAAAAAAPVLVVPLGAAVPHRDRRTRPGTVAPAR